jgi:hypothetical protein
MLPDSQSHARDKSREQGDNQSIRVCTNDPVRTGADYEESETAYEPWVIQKPRQRPLASVLYSYTTRQSETRRPATPIAGPDCYATARRSECIRQISLRALSTPADGHIMNDEANIHRVCLQSVTHVSGDAQRPDCAFGRTHRDPKAEAVDYITCLQWGHNGR